MAIKHVVDMIEGLDNDYNDRDEYTFKVFTDPLDEGVLGVTIEWEDDDRESEEYEIKIARVV